MEAKDSVAEAVRVSHCAHPYPDTHKCIGTCKITPKGVILECSQCGDGKNTLEMSEGYVRLRQLLGLIGIRIEYLDEDTVKRMLELIK